MFDSASAPPPIVFLHVPKTAGQTIHNELSRAIGAEHVSPIRVHTQARAGAGQFPEGFRLYSGHIDWVDLAKVPKPRFVFSILRDPRERIASFYFFLRREAERLSKDALGQPQNIGKKNVLALSPDDYFFGGSDGWRRFIEDHYDNFYCRYFASQKIRAGNAFSAVPPRKKLRMALANLRQIDWIYSVDNLGELEEDLKTLYGFEVNLTSRRDNAGMLPQNENRWPKLLELFETDEARRRIEGYATLDEKLMSRLGL